MITINELAIHYGPKLLFTDVNLNLNKGNKYALVGANGSGKSTFLKIISKVEEPNFGEININKGARIGWLKQDQFLYQDKSLIEAVIAGNEELASALEEKQALMDKQATDDETGYRLAELEQIIFDNEGYTADIIAKELLTGLGIDQEYHNQPLNKLSGGYKLRVLLAQSLFCNPDILLLDEPTNHLDILSIYWLENYLRQKFKGVLLFISHDVSFLNNLATHILDIDYGEIRQYVGNYNNFNEQKKLLMQQKLSELNLVEKKIAQMRIFVEKFRASATRSKQSASREKMIDKMEIPDIKNTSRLRPKFNFKVKKNSGKEVLQVNKITKEYKDKKVLNNISFSINRGEKVIIIGANGVGKSTLLKIINNKVEASFGKFNWGLEINISYFAQDYHDELNNDESALDWLSNQISFEPESKIRAIMGQVLFKKEEVYKKLDKLSGGEAARLLIAKIMLEEANILLLDEPTNHLDIEAKEELKEALLAYSGTLIMVTHDRDFAKSIADRIIAISEKKVIDFKGSYEEYLERFAQDYLVRN